MRTIPKAKQTLTKGEQKLLFFLFLFQPADKSLLRLVGNNYDFTGRQISSLFQKGYIEEITISPQYGKKEKVIQLTSLGTKIILPSVQLSSSLIQKNKNKIKGDENKYRQYKLTSLIELFAPIFPTYCSQFLNLENNLSGSNPNIEKESENRASKGPFLLTSREIRDMDEYNLRKITSTRSQGVAVAENSIYILYNHNHKRMRSHGDFEEKFHIFTENNFPFKNISALHFGKSFKPAIDTLFKTNLNGRENFIMTKSIFQNHYFVPLTKNGSDQLQIYLIPDFRDRIKQSILLPDEISGGQNFVYDGIAENGDILYLGFECNVSEIEKVIYSMQMQKQNTGIRIYCFEHQANFYRQIFKEKDTIIYPLKVNEVISSII